MSHKDVSMILDDVKKLNIPKAPGCYLFKDSKGKVIYIGKAANLRSRVWSYWQRGAGHTSAKYSMMKQIAVIDWMETDSEIEALLLEANLIKKNQPRYNVALRDDKRFLYIKISTSDEIPGVFTTRKLDRSGKYFGPFTGARAVRETLKVIRKIWPYCAETRVKEKPCFYAQINRCTGVCAGNYNIKDYEKNIIKPILMFLSGQKKSIIKQMEREKNRLEKAGNEDGAARIKFQLRNMKHILEHANVISVAEKYAADVIELAKVLGLSRVPERIEGYDISNIFGREAVGSMVVFSKGEPDKSEYRKFKIKLGQGEANDVGMLREVLERRLRRVEDKKIEKPSSAKATAWRARKQNNVMDKNWPNPDLIIVDGGKAQLNVVVRMLKKYGLDIPALAVSKGEGLRSAMAPDKIFFPGEKKPLELPLASPTLHIIKRTRDEAHRFAISYHRQLRKKRLLK